jgi:hypothetical protein
MVHHLRDACDLAEPIHGEVDLPAHQPHDLREADELILLCRSQWMCFEKRNDRPDEITEGPDAVSVQVFPMIIVASVTADMAAFEVLLQFMQHVHAPGSLNHTEVRLNLPTETTALVPEDRNTEAAFAVDEADDPLLEPWPFLLIARTDGLSLGMAAPYCEGGTASTAGYSGFPAYSRLHSTRHRIEGQDLVHVQVVYLSTVIVTAAVYWRLSSELRPASRANPSP